MKAVHVLPKGYREIYAIDLQKDKKMALIVNLIAAAIALALIVPMLFLVPISGLFDMTDGLVAYVVRFAALIGLMLLYMVLHEFVHGISMKLYGTQKINYGFTGMYAYAGSDDYYGKSAYIFIALAPVVLWGAVIAAVNPFVPEKWFWVVYLLQVINLSGAAGDFFVSLRFCRMPKDILVKDYGVGMTVYSREKSLEEAHG